MSKKFCVLCLIERVRRIFDFMDPMFIFVSLKGTIVDSFYAKFPEIMPVLEVC